MGVDISQVTGSGPGGRISDADLRAYTRQQLQGGGSTPSAPAGSALAAASLPDFAAQGEIERQSLSNVRRATATQMGRAWTIPHVTQFDRADITELEKLRKQFGPRAEKAGGKLTPTALLIKAVVGALRRFPQFNSSLDLPNEELILKKFINIGIAVDTDRGLLVPVIRDADKKGAIGLAVELTEMAERARNRKTGLDEMSGGTFTITNLGGIGGTNFTPIINTPEVAILGVARATMEPVWNGETSEFEPRLLMPLALSYDHRVIDGADGARFLRFVCELLEDPFLLALEG
jgi:pyruvate dehydrogenase E2 component (dihydrolipoamide acetyltransferase)